MGFLAGLRAACCNTLVIPATQKKIKRWRYFREAEMTCVWSADRIASDLHIGLQGKLIRFYSGLVLPHTCPVTTDILT